MNVVQPFDYDARGFPVVDAVLGECGACLSFLLPAPPLPWPAGGGIVLNTVRIPI